MLSEETRSEAGRVGRLARAAATLPAAAARLLWLRPRLAAADLAGVWDGGAAALLGFLADENRRTRKTALVALALLLTNGGARAEFAAFFGLPPVRGRLLLNHFALGDNEVDAQFFITRLRECPGGGRGLFWFFPLIAADFMSGRGEARSDALRFFQESMLQGDAEDGVELGLVPDPLFNLCGVDLPADPPPARPAGPAKSTLRNKTAERAPPSFSRPRVGCLFQTQTANQLRDSLREEPGLPGARPARIARDCAETGQRNSSGKFSEFSSQLNPETIRVHNSRDFDGFFDQGVAGESPVRKSRPRSVCFSKRGRPKN